MFQFHFLPFIFAFICGIIYMIAVSILEERQTISKTPTPFSKNHLYTDIDGELNNLSDFDKPLKTAFAVPSEIFQNSSDSFDEDKDTFDQTDVTFDAA